jgi:AraC-like DNA-binding protein
MQIYYLIQNLDLIVAFAVLLLLLINLNKSKLLKNAAVILGLFVISELIERNLSPYVPNITLYVKPLLVLIFLFIPYAYYHLLTGRNLLSLKENGLNYLIYLSIFIFDVILILVSFNTDFGNVVSSNGDLINKSNFYRTYGMFIEMSLMTLNLFVYTVRSINYNFKHENNLYSVILPINLTINSLLFLLVTFNQYFSRVDYLSYFANLRQFWVLSNGLLFISILIKYNLINKRKRLNYKYVESEIDKLIKSGEIFKPGLTVNELAKKLDMNSRDLSQIINKIYKKNFSNWINSLRVERSKKLLSENKNFTIEAIAKESGFNSKSNFNRVFKIETNLTPSEWLSGQDNVQDTVNTQS